MVTPNFLLGYQEHLLSLALQSWTKLVKKIANFGHICQSHLRNTPLEEQQTFTPPSPSLNVALKAGQ